MLKDISKKLGEKFKTLEENTKIDSSLAKSINILLNKLNSLE